MNRYMWVSHHSSRKWAKPVVITGIIFDIIQVLFRLAESWELLLSTLLLYWLSASVCPQGYLHIKGRLLLPPPFLPETGEAGVNLYGPGCSLRLSTRSVKSTIALWIDKTYYELTSQLEAHIWLQYRLRQRKIALGLTHKTSLLDFNGPSLQIMSSGYQFQFYHIAAI